MPSYLQIRTSTLRILIVGMRATPENVLGLFITGSFGNRANMHSVATPLLFFIRVAMKRKQRVRHRGSTNTEPGADRGPQTGSPAGVVVATGPNVQYTKRSMFEFRDEHRDIHNRLSCKGICNQTSSRSLSLPVPYLCIAASRFR